MLCLIASHSIAYSILIILQISLVSLPWDSVWTWLFSFLALDFFFYLSHRYSHELNVLWLST